MNEEYTIIRQMLIDWLDDNYHFGDAEEMICDDEMSFMDNAILDSLGFVQLILYLENNFNIRLERKDLSRTNFDGMNKIISYITSHKDYNGLSS